VPIYGTFAIPAAIYPQDVVTVWAAEAIATDGKSERVAVSPSPVAGVRSLSIDGFFSGAPGAFQINLEAAENDVDANYVGVAGGIITTVDANQHYHLDAPEWTARFARLKMVSVTNAVNSTATIGG